MVLLWLILPQGVSAGSVQGMQLGFSKTLHPTDPVGPGQVRRKASGDISGLDATLDSRAKAGVTASSSGSWALGQIESFLRICGKSGDQLR